MKDMTNRFGLLLTIVLLLATSTLFAQEQVFQLDPMQSQVSWTLGDVLHTVHGTFQLKSGVLRFDSATGTASGELVVDATTGQSGSNARDKKMKKEILETDKYPTIVFAPQHVIGTVASNGGSQVQLQGSMTLHGQGHPVTLVIPVLVNGNQTSADVHFDVPVRSVGTQGSQYLVSASRQNRSHRRSRCRHHDTGRRNSQALSYSTCSNW